jgi:hypothetical protein
MYSGKDYCSRTKKRRGKRVREEAIYSGGRLAGGWSAGRQVVCLRHNRTGRTCDICVDYRGLNKINYKDCCLLLLIYKTLQNIRKAK